MYEIHCMDTRSITLKRMGPSFDAAVDSFKTLLLMMKIDDHARGLFLYSADGPKLILWAFKTGSHAEIATNFREH